VVGRVASLYGPQRQSCVPGCGELTATGVETYVASAAADKATTFSCMLSQATSARDDVHR
jgi:hypothetical protein